MARRRPMNRHTMGQDWGGRRRENPVDAPRVSRNDVLAAAAELAFTVRKSRRFAGWEYHDADRGWCSAGSTNFLCVQFMRSERGNSIIA
jgi:hypothetical protein